MPDFDLSAPWKVDVDALLKGLGTSPDKGLSGAEAAKRLATDGPNDLEREKNVPAWRIFLGQFTSPLTLILIGASFISFALGDREETGIILLVIFASGVLAFLQEYRSEKALRLLRKKLTRKANVIRNGTLQRISATELAVGDVVELELGSVVPADLRLIQLEDLQVDESVITGESEPVAKSIAPITMLRPQPQDQINIAFLGTHVVQGSGLGVVTGIGKHTEVGRTAALLSQKTEETDFQKGVRSFGNFLLKITLGLTIVVALILGLVRGQWAESLLFALALAVGISPELLPVIVTINLSRGALAMSKKKVLVKRLIGIEDLGNADVFCTDKTGTLTVGKLRVRESIDPDGHANPLPLAYAAHCIETSSKGRASNPVDEAIQESVLAGADTDGLAGAKRFDIISFDFQRRMMSCVIGVKADDRQLVTKGAVAETVAACTHRLKGKASVALTEHERAAILKLADGYGNQGQRLVAVARKTVASKQKYSPHDERELELLGFIQVSDAPKVTAKMALQSLKKLNVRIVILTGDNEQVTRHVASELGFDVTGVVTGEQLAAMNDATLRASVEKANVFARITPEHKLRIIQALKKNKHTVGYMGDGVNDAPALRAADVGVSFENAIDVAKEAAGIILLKKNLSVLADGIREGRKTFINTRTYLRATISSNFGNMLSVAGAALLLPFIPLLPAQILLLNLLTDFPMLAISTDHVAEEEIDKPKKWDIQQMSGFMYFFGIISSLADYATFAILLFVAHANVDLFRSSWFIESVLTEIIVIFFLRSRRLRLNNPPGIPLLVSSAFIVVVSYALVQSTLGKQFSLIPLPMWINLAILGIVVGYAVLTQLGKVAYYRFKEAGAD
ncbi:MAG: magnesium-translocating P-type ATPase [Patescibacteria group bacterium]